MPMESFTSLLNQARPYLLVIWCNVATQPVLDCSTNELKITTATFRVCRVQYSSCHDICNGLHLQEAALSVKGGWDTGKHWRSNATQICSQKGNFCRRQSAPSEHIQDHLKGAVNIRKSRLTFAVERANTAICSIYLDVRLLATFYGERNSKLEQNHLQNLNDLVEYSQETAYYILGLLVKERGSVFLCASNPLSMVMVAILGSFIFKEKLYVGRYVRIKLQHQTICANSQDRRKCTDF
ncbi:hypothetical protein POTOM_038728 [Populus tomentosa]|uniref:Uncharacterized protein n=1 Tax=Populus tomentosa TaxID=118781 RepID=A0A8X7YSY7_POPTO|nr:hypothetical protein POTOM_038728 [Populus tomentosa]